MPSLKKSEKTLLIIFLVALFLVVNFFLYTQVSAVQRRVESTVKNLELQQLETKDLLAEKEIWEARADWLESRQPVFSTRDQADLKLLNAVRTAAQKHGIELKSEKLPETREHPEYVEAVARVEAMGDLESILRWLYELQRPDEFRAVTFLELTPEKEDPARLNCEAQVERWYAKQ